MAVGSSGRSTAEAQMQQQTALSASVAALGESVASVEAQVAGLDERLDERLGGLDAQLASLSEAVAEAGAAGAGAGERVAGLAAELEKLGEGVGSNVSAALRPDLEGLRERIAALGGTIAGLGAAGGTAGGEGSAAAGDAGERGGAAAGTPIRVGQTAILGEGLRVFLSRIDEANGSARVSIGGQGVSTLTLAEPVELGDCTLELTGIAAGEATVAGSCGGGEAAAAVPSGSGEGTEVRVGSVLAMAEGLRVFLSGADPERGTARVAVNGTETTMLSIAEPVSVGDCEVELTGFGSGSAIIDGGC